MSGNDRPSPLDAAVGGVAQLWTQAARSTQRILTGSYTLGDAISDANGWMATSATLAMDVTAGWLRPPAAVVSSPPAAWTATCKVFPSVRQRPLRLRPGSFRAIGSGERQRLPASAVTISPRVLRQGEDTFEVKVRFRDAGGRTLVYEGSILSEETRAPVTDPVRPNNRDDGPVR